MSISKVDLQYLDFTQEGALPQSIADLYKKEADEIRPGLADFMSSVAVSAENYLDWWLEAPASRNPMYSKLHHQFSALLTLQVLLRRGLVPQTIKVDNSAMKHTVRKLLIKFGSNSHIELPEFKVRFSYRLRKLASPWRSVFSIFLEWTLVRLSTSWHLKDRLQTEKLVLIDTFAIPGFVLDDRYYGDLFEKAPKWQRSLVFVPQFSNFSTIGLWRAVKLLRRYPEKYLIKYDWISLADLGWTFKHYFRIGSLPLKSLHFRGFYVGQLVLADISSRLSFRCALRGLLNYRFARSLSQAGVSIWKTIDWFENHQVDKGWNAGFNTFYPQSQRVGYSGFYPGRQCNRPSRAEYEAKILPQCHLLMGVAFSFEFCEFFEKCCVSSAPAFRYQTLPNLKELKSDQNIILVTLPYYKTECMQLISIVSKLQQRQSKWKFVIKPHPATSLNEIQVGILSAYKNIMISNQRLEVLLPKSSVMISGLQSSALLEAAACAVPTVLVSPPVKYFENSIPSAIPSLLYDVTIDIDEVEILVQRSLRKAIAAKIELTNLAEDVRRRCITPVNFQTIDRMIASDERPAP